jgi:hypothetical protein
MEIGDKYKVLKNEHREKENGWWLSLKEQHYHFLIKERFVKKGAG